MNNPSTTRYGNWWEWQIGSPRLLMDIVAALHDELTPARVAAARAADRRRLSVLANDSRRQAVSVPSLGLTAVNFGQAGTAGPLTASAAASVLVRRRGRIATLCVSEPPRTGEALEVVWDHPVRRVVRADPAVEVLATGRRLRLRITPGKACATHECEVALS